MQRSSRGKSFTRKFSGTCSASSCSSSVSLLAIAADLGVNFRAARDRRFLLLFCLGPRFGAFGVGEAKKSSYPLILDIVGTVGFCIDQLLSDLAI